MYKVLILSKESSFLLIRIQSKLYNVEIEYLK